MSQNEQSLALEKAAKISKAHDEDSKTLLGFWLYLMTDCVLFASLFAAYAVLHNNTFGGDTAHQLFSLPYALTETLLLLTSSFTCGLAILAGQIKNKKLVISWLIVTALLGLAFLGMEFSEFNKLINEGNAWHRSGFLSSYFTLVGTHGLHITIGLMWMIVMVFRVYKAGLKRITIRQLTLLSLFWHFLDVIWIFIFSVVYLMGGLGL